MNKVGGVIRKVFPRASVISVKQLKKGCVNKTFEVKINNPKKELILRLFPKEGWKAVKEAYIYDLIAKNTDVPVPVVHLVDTSQNILPKSFTLLSKVQGKELTINNKKLIEKAGEYLAKIHSIQFDKFGWIVGKEIKPAFKKWVDFCEYDLNHKLRNLKKYDGKFYIKKIKKYFDENKHIIDIETEPCLIHKDYHFSHILVDKDRINGIIDVEWAISGHAELDLAKSLMWMFEGNTKLEQIFLKGYQNYGFLDNDFRKRRKLYELLISVSSALFACELNSNKWLRYHTQKLGEIVK